jgi:GH24 family phage-related lysozyme (muramidase)
MSFGTFFDEEFAVQTAVKRRENKAKIAELLNKYGSKEALQKNIYGSDWYTYLFADGDKLIDEVEAERVAKQSVPTTEMAETVAPKTVLTRSELQQNRDASSLGVSRMANLSSFGLPLQQSSIAEMNQLSVDNAIPNNQPKGMSQVSENSPIDDEFIDKLTHMEGNKHSPYRDSKGILTVGYGQNVNTFDDFNQVNFMAYKSNRLATPDEKKAAFYGFDLTKEPTVEITDDEANRLLHDHLNKDLISLQRTFEDFDQFPKPLQQVLLDIQYNTGNVSERNWPKLHQAIRARDVNAIAENVHRKDVQEDRNNWARNKILSISYWPE